MNLKTKLAEIENTIRLSRHKSGRDMDVKIVAVTKTHPPETIIEAYRAGIRTIGENRVQEAVGKFAELPDFESLEKRFIGHLQSNKINKALALFDTIDSIDRLSLARKIGSRTGDITTPLKALLEVNTSGEESKSGFHPENIDDMLACLEIKGLFIEGLMTVGPLTRNEKKIRAAFTSLRNLLETINRQKPSDIGKLTELSMGMSDDFEIAVEEGSTQVRLGTILFGERHKWQGRR